MYILRQVLHGCRQLVSWDVWLSPLFTSATPFIINFQILNNFINTAINKMEEGRDDVKSSWPLWTGLLTCYNNNYNEKQLRKFEQIFKNYLSSDYSLQLENMKLESLVIVDQHATVNLYTDLVHTARHALGISFILNLFWNYYMNLL